MHGAHAGGQAAHAGGRGAVVHGPSKFRKTPDLQRKRCVAQLRPGCSLSLSAPQSHNRALYRAFTKRRIGLVQGLWRMRVAARRVRARRRVHGRAATVVQRWGRRWHGYREAGRRRRLRGGGPARAIQRVFRGLRGMRVGNRKRFERDTRAACVIQARSRSTSFNLTIINRRFLRSPRLFPSAIDRAMCA